MSLRGWRLFGVAGTIFAYVAGILLLSIVSLNSPGNRRARNGRIGEYDAFRHRDINILGKRQPLQWCQALRFLDGISHNKSMQTTKQPKLMQTFPGHYVKPQYVQYSLRGGNIKSNVKFDDRYIDSTDKKLDKTKKDEIKISYEKIWPKHVKFKNLQNDKIVKEQEQPRNLIALASFPGSGNTWLRYLLQQATGIFTGSVYKDFGLLKSGFPAENIFNSSVLVVKTHEWGPNAWVHFSKAILLVRDPDKSILAEFNRQSGGHVGFASPDRYKRAKGRYWQQFVTNKLWAWEQMNIQWAKNFTGDVFIIYYDFMVDDVEGTLRKTLKFIDFPINENLLSCALSRKEGIYRRKKRILTFDPYTPAMHRVLEQKKREVYSEIGINKF